MNQRAGWRLSAHGAFLRPVLGRPNLHVRSNLHVERLDLAPLEARGEPPAESGVRTSSGREPLRAAATEAGWPRAASSGSGGSSGYLVCRGVVVQAASDVRGALRTLRARKEVILAAGAVGSPHLLQCSGVGPSPLLKRHAVATALHLPGVGQNLQDHLQIRSVFKLGPDATTLNSRTKAGSLVGQALIGLEYLWNRSGPLAMAPSQFGLFAHSGLVHPCESNVSNAERNPSGSGPNRPATPDLQFHVQPLSLENLSDPSSLHPFPGLTASVRQEAVVPVFVWGLISLFACSGLCFDSSRSATCAQLAEALSASQDRPPNKRRPSTRITSPRLKHRSRANRQA